MPEPKTIQCETCKRSFVKALTGRTPKYCSPSCKEKARPITDERKAKSRKYGNKHYALNKEKRLAQNSAWAKSNPEKTAAYCKKSKDLNRDKVRSKAREYHWKERDKVLEQKRQYRERNPSANKDYYWKNLERCRSNARLAMLRRRTRLTEAGGSHTKLEWIALLDSTGHKCLCCGSKDATLTADHVVPVSRGGSSDISNIQPLCGPCNSRKKDKTSDYRVNHATAA